MYRLEMEFINLRKWRDIDVYWIKKWKNIHIIVESDPDKVYVGALDTYSPQKRESLHDSRYGKSKNFTF